MSGLQPYDVGNTVVSQAQASDANLGLYNAQNNTALDDYNAFISGTGGYSNNLALGMTQSADAASATSPWDIVNGNTSPALTPAELAAQGAANLAAAAALNPGRPTDEQLYQQKEDFYGGLINRFDNNSVGLGEIPAFLGADSVAARDAAAYAASPEGIAASAVAQQDALLAAQQAALLSEQQASQAIIDAAAVTQQQQDDFQTKVNAAGGMNKGTIGDVIDAAQDSFGGNTSRAIVTVIAEALKSGVTIDDLAAETGMTQAAIVAAAKDAGQDPAAKLSTQEIIEGGLDTAYDVVNSAIDLVEKGFEVTGLEKLIDLATNTVAKVVGLDPSKASKVLTIDPTTGRVIITASNQPGGGTGGYLPSSPQVTIGTTPGNTTYGTTTGNKVLTTIFDKIRNKGSLDASDIPGLLTVLVADAADFNPSAVTGIIAAADDGIKAVQDAINGEDDDENGGQTTVTLGGSTGTTNNLPICPPGQTQIDEPGDCTVAATTVTTTETPGGTDPVTDEECPPGQTKDPVTGICGVPALVPPAGDGGTADEECPPGQTKDPVTGICGVPAGVVVAPEAPGFDVDPVLTPDNECPLGQTRNPLTGNCEVTAGGVVPPVEPPVVTDNVICPDGTALAGQDVPADGNCNPVAVIPPGEIDPECPGGIYNEATDTCGYTDLSCATIGFVLDLVTGFCKAPPKEEEEDDRTVVPPTTLGLPPRFVGESDVLVEDPGAFQMPYSILPAPVTDPYLADRRSRDILNVASSVGIQPGAAEQPQQAVDRFAQYANNFDIGLPELSSITGTPVSDFPAFEEKYGISLPQIGTAPPVAPTSLDPVTGLPIRTPISGQRYVPEPTALLPTLLEEETSMFADGGVVENGGGIESLLDRRQQAVNRMLTKRARGLM
jgi:hypothetical protein